MIILAKIDPSYQCILSLHLLWIYMLFYHAVHLTSSHRRVLTYWPPASQQTSHLQKTSLNTQQRSCLQRTAIFLQIPSFSFGKECKLCAHRCYLSAWQITIIWIQILRSTKPQYITIYCLFQKNGLHNFLHTECTFKVTYRSIRNCGEFSLTPIYVGCLHSHKM